MESGDSIAARAELTDSIELVKSVAAAKSVEWADRAELVDSVELAANRIKPREVSQFIKLVQLEGVVPLHR